MLNNQGKANANELVTKHFSWWHFYQIHMVFYTKAKLIVVRILRSMMSKYDMDTTETLHDMAGTWILHIKKLSIVYNKTQCISCFEVSDSGIANNLYPESYILYQILRKKFSFGRVGIWAVDSFYAILHTLFFLLNCITVSFPLFSINIFHYH